MYKILHVGRCKDRNHVIISIDVQNVFAKVLHFTTTTTTKKSPEDIRNYRKSHKHNKDYTQ